MNWFYFFPNNMKQKGKVRKSKSKSKSKSKKEKSKSRSIKIARKVPLERFNPCHPSLKATSHIKQIDKTGNYYKTAKCLPKEVYDRTGSYESLKCTPGSDHCLLDHSALSHQEKDNLRKRYLRPKRPKEWYTKPDTWLDNENIDHVMKQYEVANPWFKFLGVFPIDFASKDPESTEPKCLYPETCNINIEKEYNNKPVGRRGIGIIFNLDPHDKGGSHWVGLYINIWNKEKPIISYFDSYGLETPPTIAHLMKTFVLQKEHCELSYNARRFQFGHSECGMFSMYFIICMMSGIPFRQFCKDSVPDELMLKLRHVLFAE